jgi:hypothetical protein
MGSANLSDLAGTAPKFEAGLPNNVIQWDGRSNVIARAIKYYIVRFIVT